VLECSASNDEDSPNSITFVWFKDDILLNNTNSMDITVSGHRLSVEHLDPRKHTGNYSCGVYNNKVTDSVFTNTTVTIESKL